jgi:hypothetical protein
MLALVATRACLFVLREFSRPQMPDNYWANSHNEQS